MFIKGEYVSMKETMYYEVENILIKRKCIYEGEHVFMKGKIYLWKGKIDLWRGRYIYKGGKKNRGICKGLKNKMKISNSKKNLGEN